MEQTKDLRRRSAIMYLGITMTLTLLGVLTGFFAGSFGDFGPVVRPTYAPPMLLLRIMQPLVYFALSNAIYFLYTAERFPVSSRATRGAAMIALLTAFAVLISLPYLYYYGQFYTTCFLLGAFSLALTAGSSVLLFYIDKKAAVAALFVAVWLVYVVALLVGIAMYN